MLLENYVFVIIYQIKEKKWNNIYQSINFYIVMVKVKVDIEVCLVYSQKAAVRRIIKGINKDIFNGRNY